MNELKNTISQIVACSIQKIIISKPQEKSNPYKKITSHRAGQNDAGTGRKSTDR